MIKIAFIRKIKPNTWRVFSSKGRNLGTYHSLKAAKKRLKDVEFFKRKNARLEIYNKIASKHNHHDESTTTYSEFLRNINKKNSKNIINIMSKFKDIFDKALLDETPVDELENTCLLELMAKMKKSKDDNES